MRRVIPLLFALIAGMIGGAISSPVSATVESWYGSFFVRTGGVINDANATASSCAGYDASKNLKSGTSCVQALTGGTGIVVGSGTIPSVGLAHGDYLSSICAAPSNGDICLGRTASSGLIEFGTGSFPQGYLDYGINHAGAWSLTNGTQDFYLRNAFVSTLHAGVSGGYTNPGILIGSNVSSGLTQIGSSTGAPAGGIDGSALYVGNYTVNNLLALDVAGNLGIAGGYYGDGSHLSNISLGTSSATSSGYAHIGGGMMLEWGTSTLTSSVSPVTIMLPTAMPNNLFQVTASNDQTANCSGGVGVGSIGVGGFTRTSFVAIGGGCQAGFTYVAHWFAVGN